LICWYDLVTLASDSALLLPGQARDDEYLIDIQRLQGDVFIFLEAVSKIIVEMRM
jgi:hypothetical protein